MNKEKSQPLHYVRRYIDNHISLFKSNLALPTVQHNGAGKNAPFAVACDMGSVMLYDAQGYQVQWQAFGNSIGDRAAKAFRILESMNNWLKLSAEDRESAIITITESEIVIETTNHFEIFSITQLAYENQFLFFTDVATADSEQIDRLVYAAMEEFAKNPIPKKSGQHSRLSTFYANN